MTVETDDPDRKRQQVRQLARRIELALMHRPGAAPPWSPYSTAQVLDRLGAGPLVLADVQQLDVIEQFVGLWLELLPLAADACWSDSDDTAQPPPIER